MLKYYLVTNIFLLFCSVLSVYLVDVPLIQFMNEYGLTFYIDKYLIHRYSWISSEKFLGVLLLLFLVYLFKIFYIKKVKNGFGLFIFILTFLYLILELKVGLKFIFGRCLPHFWLKHTCSFGNGFSTFNWFQGVNHEGSFPSGHCLLITYLLSWIYYIQRSSLRIIVLFLAIVIFVLVVSEVHYLGDCLAGVSFGGLSFIFTVVVYRNLDHWRQNYQIRKKF